MLARTLLKATPDQPLNHMPVQFLGISTFVSFAISQPVYSVIGENPTFLVAHHVNGLQLVLFAILVWLIPTCLLVALVQLVTRLNGRLGSILHISVLGILSSLLLAPNLNRTLGFSGWLGILALLTLAIAASIIFARMINFERMVRFASFSPILFILYFLFISPASQLLFLREVEVHRSSGKQTLESFDPIIWIVFDQLPLSFLINDQREIIRERFPNFSRLAQISTWYPNTLSVALETRLSMPSALSGKFAAYSSLPVASQFPNNVFTLLGETHKVYADEYVTQLCPDALCLMTLKEVSAAPAYATLLMDTWTILIRVLLPETVADHLVPSVSDRWHDFRNLSATDPSVADEVRTESEIRARRSRRTDDRARFDRFLASILLIEEPSFHYIHLFQPHEPLRFLPGGHKYSSTTTFKINDSRWPNNDPMMDVRLQEYILQVMHADYEVGRLLDLLEESGKLKESLLIVMSDHGVSTRPGTLNKILTPSNSADLLPVPLFIKLSGQTEGKIDLRYAQQTDAVASIAEALGSKIYSSDGESLLGPINTSKKPYLITESGLEELVDFVPATDSPSIEWIRRVMPDLNNPYAFGTHGALVGKQPKVMGDSFLRVNLVIKGSTDASPRKSFQPNTTLATNITGKIVGNSSPVDVAVACNGFIAGVGRSFENEGWNIAVKIDPACLRIDGNVLELYEITSTGLMRVQVNEPGES